MDIFKSLCDALTPKRHIERMAMRSLAGWSPCTTTNMGGLYPSEIWLLDRGFLKTRSVPGFIWLEITAAGRKACSTI